MIKGSLIEFQRDLPGVSRRDNKINTGADAYGDSTFFEILTVKSGNNIDNFNDNRLGQTESNKNSESTRVNSSVDKSGKTYNSKDEKTGKSEYGKVDKPDKIKVSELSDKNSKVNDKGSKKAVNNDKVKAKSGGTDKLLKAFKDNVNKKVVSAKKASERGSSAGKGKLTGRPQRGIDTLKFAEIKSKKGGNGRVFVKNKIWTGGRKRFSLDKNFNISAEKDKNIELKEKYPGKTEKLVKRLSTDKNSGNKGVAFKLMKKSKAGDGANYNQNHSSDNNLKNEINELAKSSKLNEKSQSDKNSEGFKFDFASLLKKYDSNVPVIRGESAIFTGMAGNGAEKIFDDIIKHFSYVVTKGGGEAKLMLKPPELGNLKMSIKVENGKVSAIIIVDNPTIKEVIDSRLNVLQQNLLEQGFSLGSFEVGVKEQKSEGNPAGSTYKTSEASDRLIEEDVSRIGEEGIERIEATLPWMSSYINLTV